MTAQNVGDKLRGLDWIGIVFAGGMSELAHVSCRSIVVNDLHRHVINLAAVVGHEQLKPQLAMQLDGLPFHPDVLNRAQRYCVDKECGLQIELGTPDFAWAVNYFVASWMGRSAKAGTEDEFKGGLSTRWTSSGGDSNTRYRSAIESLDAWQKIMQRCNFSTLDFREFLAKCKDQNGHGVYADPPFPGASDKYKHNFSEPDHRDLARLLTGFSHTKVVVRFYDHPLIRELYPDDYWHWHSFPGRKQSNAESPEVLITNRHE